MRRAVLFAALLTVVLTAGGCSNREPIQAQAPQARQAATATPGPDGVQQVTIQGTQGFRFVPSLIKAKAGALRITLHNQGSTPHDLEIEPMKASTGVVSAGESRSVTVTLSTPGRYDFICTFHTRLHMDGTIVVS